MSSGMRVETSGPIFDGSAAVIAGEFADHVAREVAGFAGNRVVGEMQAHFRHPRPHYWTLITVTHDGGSQYTVESQPHIVYEHWLNGTGSRNPRSRFQGYPHWKLARASAHAAVLPTQQRLWPEYRARLGG